ncbi:MAG: DHH family phosphoesterase [Candidatus Hodarchaeaceae archaeon]|nr:DHH family phosphoesterase [Candidatus Hodarchaeaceae archaeon]
MKEIAGFLADASRRGQRILVLCHHNADPDAVGSSLALVDALNQLGARARAGVSESIGRVARSVLDAIGLDIPIDPPLDADIIVLVDTSSLEHLGKLGEQVKGVQAELVVIDHHKPVEEMQRLAKLYLVLEDQTSQSEVVLQLIRELGAELKPEMAFLLLAGIVSDTGQFRLAKEATFEAVHALVEAGANYRRVLGALKLPEDLSRRVALLKAAQRLELHHIRGWIVVLSEVGSFEADAAAMLIRIGADVALVGSEDKGKIRICARAREGLCEETHLNLSDLMSELAKSFCGAGGGHAGAASMNGEGKLAEAKKQALQMLQRMLEPK